MTIGHQEALREETPDGWRYIDTQNQKLKEALQPYDIQLELLDSFIEKLEADGEVIAGQLRERRRYALWAYNNRRKFQELGLEVWQSYLEVIMCQMRMYELGETLLPFVNARPEARKNGAEANRQRAAYARKFVEEENAKMIRDGAAMTPPRRYGQEHRAREIQKKMEDKGIKMFGKPYAIRSIKDMIKGT